MRYTHRAIALSEIQEFVKKFNPKNILEIGPGDNPFKDEFTYDSYKMIDIKSLADDVIEMDVHDMIFNGEFDCVFSCHVAEHFRNPLLALKNIHNSLQKNGLLFMITPYPCEHQILHGDDTHFFVLNQDQWTRLLIELGFKEINSYVQTKYKSGDIPKEQDYNIITIARK